MPQKEYLGGVSATTLSGTITDVSASFTVATGGGASFPTGAVYPFVVVIGRGTASEEKILCASRSGDTFTVTTRGYDGTSAVAHSGGPAVEHCIDALVINEASAHVNDTSDAHAASAITNTPAGTIVATTVQAAINELDTDVSGLDTSKAPKASPTFTGTVTLPTTAMADAELGRAKLKDYAETLHAHGNTSTTETIDLENGNVHSITLDANCTLTFSNPPATGIAGSFTLVVTQDATGSRTLTWPASVKWSAGTAPTLTTTANAVNVLSFLTLDAGTTWYGFLAGVGFA